MSTLADRMKDYESIPRTRLTKRVPVMMRLDGKAFHTLTKGMDRPRDTRFCAAMEAAMLHLCENIPGVRLGYTQSDEISLLLTDWGSYNTQPWFDYEVQKLVSVAAAMCSVAFTSALRAAFHGQSAHEHKVGVFDCRVWNLPDHEVANVFIWRQQDATRNSILSLGQAHFSHRELQGLNASEIQELLWVHNDINWDACPTPQKRGVCARRVEKVLPVSESLPQGHYEKLLAEGRVTPDQTVTRSVWEIDYEIPIFTKDRSYINQYLVRDPNES